MRARLADVEGFAVVDGVKVGYELFGDGEPTVLLLHGWQVLHSRTWKCQVPYLARHYRVVTMDLPGNGRSDRPTEVEAYDEDFTLRAMTAVLDATDTDACVLVGLSFGGWYAPLFAALHPDRVLGLVLISPSNPEEFRGFKAWVSKHGHDWVRDYPGFLDTFFDRVTTEPHSTKQHEDGVDWGLETTPEALIRTAQARRPWAQAPEAVYPDVVCPALVIHGADDALLPPDSNGPVVARALRADLVTVVGGGHVPHARDPVRTNLWIRDFVDRVAPSHGHRRRWTRAAARRKRALYVSSSIGLGHARRDLAIAQELRALHPDLQIDWLTQHPVTRLLTDAGERVHPGSAALANESGHIESESAEHDLHFFSAYRRMDEILVANFMVLHDLLEEEEYDLVIGDEAWDLDYFLHENPELKRFAYVWLTDFVGWLPTPDGGEQEVALTADYNAEMLEQIARYQRIRDCAIFVGNPEDVVPDSFGPGLPGIRQWTEEHYRFVGYVTGFDHSAVVDQDGLRRDLGYGPDEQVCLVTVGGSGVGEALLRRVLAAAPEARAATSDLRMVVVTGPRIDPSSLAAPEGVEVCAYVPELYRHLAACDLAVVQGGLTTAMELTATRRPFIYVPLRRHFEQQRHVPHRLDRYGAGRRLDYDAATPEALAAAIAHEIGRDIEYQPVERDGASRAAAHIAELL